MTAELLAPLALGLCQLAVSCWQIAEMRRDRRERQQAPPAPVRVYSPRRMTTAALRAYVRRAA